MIDFKDLDDKIKRGFVAESQAALKAAVLTQVPRVDYERFANLARRSGLPHLSVRLLNSVIRAEKPLDVPPTSGERMEYAMGLVKIGSVLEGRSILAEMDSSENPLGLYYLALSYFPEWDYETAARLLEEYLGIPEIDDYQRLTAEVNLSAAYLSIPEQVERARPLLVRGLAYASLNGYRLLRGNLLELSAQLSIFTGRFDEAMAMLTKASSFLGNTGMVDELYVEKWACILHVYRSPLDREAATVVEAVKRKAIAMGHWETVRDLDYHFASQRRDIGLYHRLFHGTPFHAYRKRLRDKFHDAPAPPSEFCLLVGGADEASPELDVGNATLSGRTFGLPVGSLVHQLLILLVSDFYKPMSLAAIATRLFPREFYNPQTTPNRIHQLMRRLRQVASDADLGLEIVFEHGTYRFSAVKPLILKTSIERCFDQGSHVQFKYQLLLGEIESWSVDQVFTAKDVSFGLNCSISTATRVLRAGVETGLIIKEGQGSKSRYRLKTKVAA